MQPSPKHNAKLGRRIAYPSRSVGGEAMDLP
jgi:hypothetical protein